MKLLKWGGLGLLVALLVFIALSWTKIQRLLTVNSLFDADKIVANFSSMDSAFLHHDLAIGEPKPWPEDIQDIPETVMIAGKETKLTDALEELDTTALVIIRDGTLIHESYYKGTQRDDLRISWSVAKSFMSALYGQAIEDGLMDISQPIETYLPQLKGTAYEGASVANILNMASGVKFNEDYLDPKSDINDMARVLGLGGSMDEYTETLTERQNEPGTVWQYVSIDTHVAAMALRKVTGKTLHQLWEETYGVKLGMGKSPFYLTDGKDVAFALGGLNLRTRDYAKFGQLFLQEGKWEGQQLIPLDWVKASTVDLAPNLHPERGSGYGYQWWVPMPQEGPSKGDYFAIGIYGQYIYVNPAMNIVIAKNAADREFTFEQSNGQHSMNMNIDIFRSLAEQLAVQEAPDISQRRTECEVKAIISVTAGELPDGHTLKNFSQKAYEILREGDENSRVNYLKHVLKVTKDPSKKIPAADRELIHQQVDECLLAEPLQKVTDEHFEKELKVQSENIIRITGSENDGKTPAYSAKCEEINSVWQCNLIKNLGGKITQIDISKMVASSLAHVGIDDGYDRIHVTDVSVDDTDPNKVWVKMQSDVWKKGQRFKAVEELLIINDVIQEQ